MSYALRDYLDLTIDASARQWHELARRRDALPGKRQADFLPVETLMCLAEMYVVDHRRFGSSSAPSARTPVPELARVFRRPPSSVLAKMANIDGSRPHGAHFDVRVGTVLRHDHELFESAYRTVLAGARAAGFSQASLPDFLGIEHGGRQELLGQDEITPDAIDSMVEAELAAMLVRHEGLGEQDTTQLLVTAARVGQHRFAKDVLINCGRECVFCGFALDRSRSGKPSSGLLRASHVKAWRSSSNYERLDISNGIAACPTRDAAFDAGLLGIGTDLSVTISPTLQEAARSNAGVRSVLTSPPFRTKIELPAGAREPSRPYLLWHSAEVFVT